MIQLDALALLGPSVATAIASATAIAMMAKPPYSRITRYSDALHLSLRMSAPCRLYRSIHAIYEPLPVRLMVSENPEAWNGSQVTEFPKQLVNQKWENVSAHLGMFQDGGKRLIGHYSSTVKFKGWAAEIGDMKMSLEEANRTLGELQKLAEKKKKKENLIISAEIDRFSESLRKFGSFSDAPKWAAVDERRLYRKQLAHQLNLEECLQAIKALPHENDEERSILDNHKAVFRVLFGYSNKEAEELLKFEKESGFNYNVENILCYRAHLLQSLTGILFYDQFSKWSTELTNLQKDPNSVDKRKAVTKATDLTMSIGRKQLEAAQEAGKLKSISGRRMEKDYEEMRAVYEHAGVRKVFEEVGLRYL